MQLPHELESDEYWAAMEWVMSDPVWRLSQTPRPMFEVFHDVEICGSRGCECLT